MGKELRPYEVKVSRRVSHSEEAMLYILAESPEHARDLADTAMSRLPDGGEKGIWWEDEEWTKPESDCYDVTDVREAAPGSDAHKPHYIDWSDAIAAERDAEAADAAQQVFAEPAVDHTPTLKFQGGRPCSPAVDGYGQDETGAEYAEPDAEAPADA